jgi:hypothetical protein
MPSVSEKEATQQQYDVKNTTTFEAPAVAVFIAETPPVLPAMEPLVRSLPFAPAKQVEQFVTPPVSLPEMPAAAEITEAVPTAFRPISRIVEAIQEPVRTTAVHNNPVTPDTRETAPAIVVLPATKQRAAIVQPVETPFRPADIIPSADNAPLPVEVPFLAESPLPVSRELPVTASVPSLFEAALAPVVAVETAELPETEASAVSYATQATAFEAAIDEWLRAEAPQVGLAESPRPAEPVAQEQPVAGAITTTETAVVPETITPPIQLETALKVNVLAMLEAITQAVTEIRQSPEVAAGEPSTEIVEALCVELFAMLGSRPDDETIRAIVRDILSWLPALADGRVDGLFALPTEGTHEYKMTLAASLFTHFTQAIQRRARQIASASRYMVAHISEPLTYRFVDIPTT